MGATPGILGQLASVGAIIGSKSAKKGSPHTTILFLRKLG